MTDKHPLDGKFEPEAKQCLDPNTAALTSIAISLKRIADNMERVEVHGVPGPTPLFEKGIRSDRHRRTAHSQTEESDRRYREILGEYDPDVAMPVFDTVRK